jgi:hypothetical protein
MMACIIYWQVMEINRVLLEEDSEVAGRISSYMASTRSTRIWSGCSYSGTIPISLFRADPGVLIIGLVAAVWQGALVRKRVPRM